MKKKYSTILVACAVFALIVAAIVLIAGRTTTLEFSDLMPKKPKPESCQIICATTEGMNAIVLREADLEALVSVLESVEYVKAGSYDSVMEGTIYHAYFASQGEEIFSMHISDLGKVYIGKTAYDFSPNVISSYLETVLP